MLTAVVEDLVDQGGALGRRGQPVQLVGHDGGEPCGVFERGLSGECGDQVEHGSADQGFQRLLVQDVGVVERGLRRQFEPCCRDHDHVGGAGCVEPYRRQCGVEHHPCQGVGGDHADETGEGGGRVLPFAYLGSGHLLQNFQHAAHGRGVTGGGLLDGVMEYFAVGAHRADAELQREVGQGVVAAFGPVERPQGIDGHLCLGGVDDLYAASGRGAGEGGPFAHGGAVDADRAATPRPYRVRDQLLQDALACAEVPDDAHGSGCIYFGRVRHVDHHRAGGAAVQIDSEEHAVRVADFRRGEGAAQGPVLRDLVLGELSRHTRSQGAGQSEREQGLLQACGAHSPVVGACQEGGQGAGPGVADGGGRSPHGQPGDGLHFDLDGGAGQAGVELAEVAGGVGQGGGHAGGACVVLVGLVDEFVLFAPDLVAGFLGGDEGEVDGVVDGEVEGLQLGEQVGSVLADCGRALGQREVRLVAHPGVGLDLEPAPLER